MNSDINKQQELNQEKDENKIKRDFKGIWIPKEIWLFEGLTIAEKALWAEIDSLYDEDKGGCYASNEYLCKFNGVKLRFLQIMISNLKSKGLIEQVSFDGRQRIIKAVKPKDAAHQTCNILHGSDVPQCTHITKSIYKESISKDIPKKVASKDAHPKVYKIKLSKKEKESLIEKIGKDQTNNYTEQLKLYLKSIGKPNKYKCHYSTILNWHRRDNKNKKISNWSAKEDKKLLIAFKIYRHYLDRVCNDPCILNKSSLEMKEKTLYDSKSKTHFKKNYEEFIKLLKDRYGIPFHLINKIKEQCRLTNQISDVVKKTI